MDLFKMMQKWDHIAYRIYNSFAFMRFALVDRIRYRNYLLPIKELKDAHKGERCFIILNGPSIKNQDLSKLRDEIVFCSNRFYHSEYIETVHPNYYCIWDSAYFGEENQKQYPMSELFERNGHDTKFIFNKKAIPLIEERYLERTYFVYGQHMPNKKRIRGDLAGFSSTFVNVSLFCILCAIYMGFTNIYILGLDLFQSKTHTEIEHCYKQLEAEKQVLAQIREDRRYDSIYWNGALLYLQAKWLNEFSQKNKIKIYNVNPDSKMNQFDFYNYEDVFSSMREP